MYIEEIIIDGFKSYQNRTVISNFDPNFNAITGLNGSGKSNIIDAIIFVLGITNWSQLRVANMQHLVYKHGQAGVRKASVTLVFNNMDKDNSPVSYEKFDQITVTRQIIIGGRSKYLINGHNAQPDRIKNLFRSVQLNIKNPHFLIMQGRITKVINAKPQEILGMIEEAAGTKMYEDKKEGAIKTMDKKDRKVQEIKSILAETITPTLEQLRTQQQQYYDWLESKRDFEKYDKYRIAHDYYNAREKLAGSEHELKEYESKIKESEKNCAKLQDLIKKITAEIQRLTEVNENEISHEVGALRKQLEDISKRLVKRSANYKYCLENLQKEKEKLEDLTKSYDQLTQSINDKQTKLQSQEEKLKDLKQQQKDKKEQLENLKKQFQAISVGVAADGEGSAKTLADQLLETEQEKVKCVTEVRSSTARLKHFESELIEFKSKSKRMDNEYNSLKEEEKQRKISIKSLEEKIQSLGFSEEKYTELINQKKKLLNNIKDIQDRLSVLKMKLTRFEFFYRDPYNGFNREQVKGRVATLITVTDPNYSFSLQTTAGARLMNVVVDNEDTGKALLKNGKLTNRETFIPLNKITPKLISSAQIKNAWDQVGKTNTATALSCVNYDKSNQPAIEYVFGNTFICQSSEHANTLSSHKNIRARSVTIEGDLFDPAGTITGGAAPQNSNDLAMCYELKEKQKELETLFVQLKKIDDTLAQISPLREKYQDLFNKCELEKRGYQFLQERISQTDYHQLTTKVKELEESVQTEKENLATFEQKGKEAAARVQSITLQIKNFNKEDQLTKTKQSITQTKQKYKELTAAVDTAQQNQIRLATQIEQHLEEKKEIDVKINDSKQEEEKLAETLKMRLKKKEDLENEYDNLKSNLESKKSAQAATDSNIAQLMAQKDSNLKNISETQVNIKNIEHKIANYHTAKDQAKKHVNHLRKQYAWIEHEQQFFGKPDGDYDFDPKNVKRILERLSKAEEGQEKLSKLINKKAVTMFEKAQKEYDDLIKKKNQIEADKAQIENFIKELDKKKNEALQKTWGKVDKDFGSIFSTLLPGAKAKLVPAGKSFLEGLCVKVAFGGIWKESLSELSGGQRSLVSLSLVLSLLLFKPAPMYILDEIDSALDLSHTQNIGEMIKTHFTQSQFIVISLKEGMFNNANVLFTVKNVSGASVVSRSETNNKRSNRSSIVPHRNDPKKRKRTTNEEDSMSEEN